MNIADTTSNWTHPYYDKINSMIVELNSRNLIKFGSGFCWAMADLIHNKLKQINIKSTVIECELSIISSNPPNLIVVGHKSGIPNNPDAIQTHVVLLIEHETHPLLLDCSVAHLLPPPYTWVCGPANLGGNPIAEFHQGNHVLTYRTQTGDMVPFIHQKSVVDRIYLDRKIESIIHQFRIFRRIAMCLVIAVFITFVYDFYITITSSIQSDKNDQIIQIIKEQQSQQSGKLQDLREHLINLQTLLIKR